MINLGVLIIKTQEVMRSNKIMKRQMGEYDVLQRTSDSYFGGNALLQQWKHLHPKCKDSMKDFFEQKNVGYLS